MDEDADIFELMVKHLHENWVKFQYVTKRDHFLECVAKRVASYLPLANKVWRSLRLSS